MSFLFPLGLLGLIGVPVLIIIYIIKNKYTEQTVSATYIWTLSERFLKRKNPISFISGLISLILQILAVICISIALAHPVISLPGKAGNYCFILDSSGSMSMQNEGVTRFERGKEEIRKMIEDSANGSSYTLICSGDTMDIVFKQTEDRDRALRLLTETEASYAGNEEKDALSEAQGYFQEYANKGFDLQVYLITDKSYSEAENVKVLNVAKGESNYALTDVSSSFTEDGLVVSGNVASYGTEKTLTVSVYADDSENPVAQTQVTAKDGMAVFDSSTDESQQQTEIAKRSQSFEVVCANVSDYQILRVTIDSDDAFRADDEIVVYNIKHDNSFNTLIVSKTPFFLKSALEALGHRQIETVDPDDYAKAPVTGYGLYIFDHCAPKAMPEDGAVWFFSPTENVEGSGFSYQGPVTYESAQGMTYNKSTATTVRKLLTGIVQSETSQIVSYSKCSLNRDFTTLLSCDGNPVLFAGSNNYGNREVVFAFSLHDSDLPLSLNYLPFINNLLNYTFPEIVDSSNFFCGDIVSLNVLPGCNSIRVDTPGGKSEYLDVETAISDYRLEEVGLYTVTLQIGSLSASSRRTIRLYAQSPFSESAATASAGSFSLVGEPGARQPDGKFEDITFLFIILAVIFIADWMVYCYEQYQLR